MQRFILLILVSLALPNLRAQEVDGSDINREMIERERRVNQLSTEEQLKLRAATVQAAEDPEVKAAVQKRDEAIRAFRAALRAAMIKADPSVAPILDKVAIKEGPRGTGEAK